MMVRLQFYWTQMILWENDIMGNMKLKAELLLFRLALKGVVWVCLRHDFPTGHGVMF